MPHREVPVVTGETYHIFNRGVEKRNIFLDRRDYKRFLDTAVYYQDHDPQGKPRFSFRFRGLKKTERPKSSERLVDLVSFVLMPNHFHFLLKQRSDGGIIDFIRRVSDSYTRYFNTRYSRTGHLLSGPYKAVRIESEGQLLHTSRYIHLNPLVAGMTDNLRSYGWSSYPEYLGVQLGDRGLCSTELVLSFFSQPRGENYERFVQDQADYARSLEEIKHLLIDVKLY